MAAVGPGSITGLPHRRLSLIADIRAQKVGNEGRKSPPRRPRHTSLVRTLRRVWPPTSTASCERASIRRSMPISGCSETALRGPSTVPRHRPLHRRARSRTLVPLESRRGLHCRPRASRGTSLSIAIFPRRSAMRGLQTFALPKKSSTVFRPRLTRRAVGKRLNRCLLALIVEAAVQAFHEGIPGRFAWRSERVAEEILRAAFGLGVLDSKKGTKGR
jgi:hypothetical protein